MFSPPPPPPPPPQRPPNMGNPFFSYLRSEYSCMSVKFSPFDEKKVAVSCCDNFGIVGKGKLLILDIVPGQPMNPVQILQDHDAIFDCAWTEFDPNLIISGCGGGEIKLWNITNGKLVFSGHEHKGEVQSIECNHQNPSLILSSGMDGTSRLWDVNAQKQVQVFQTHKGNAYQATWHPIQQSMFGSVGSDGALRLWDLLSPTNKNIASIRAHQGEVMSCDFNKYEEQIATASNDKTINIWDLRNLKVPMNTLQGHRYPVRKIKFSPHDPTVLASASYDMQIIMWDIAQYGNPVLKMHSAHTEFAVGLDFSLHIPKLLASVSWDGKCLVWPWDQDQPKIQ